MSKSTIQGGSPRQNAVSTAFCRFFFDEEGSNFFGVDAAAGDGGEGKRQMRTRRGGGGGGGGGLEELIAARRRRSNSFTGARSGRSLWDQRTKSLHFVSFIERGKERPRRPSLLVRRAAAEQKWPLKGATSPLSLGEK